MFGQNTPVNSQINMYVMSRVIFGFAKLAAQKQVVPAFDAAFPLFAGTIWALVMYLFENYRNTLQKSLESSMDYLYQQSNDWDKNSDSFWEWLMK